MSPTDTAVFLSIAFIATLVSTLCGFGSALILIGVLSLFYDPQYVIGVTTFLYLFNTVNRTVTFRKSIDRDVSLLTIVSSLPAVILGAYALTLMNATPILVALGAIEFLYLANDVLGFKLAKPNRVTLVVSGVGYGFLSGLVGTGSLIKAITFKELNFSKDSFVATMAFTAVVMNVAKIVVYSKYRLVTSDDIPLIAMLLLVSLAGVRLGKYVLAYVSERMFYHGVRVVILIASISLIFRALA